jgi:hypothetical protein
VTFGDGGSASGSFVYDASTNTYSSVNITTTTGSVRNGATYTFVCTAPCNGVTPGNQQVLNLTASSSSDLTGTPGFALFFQQGLTNLGGTLLITSGQEATCNNATCSAPGAPARFTGIAASVSAVPPPLRQVPTLSEIGLAGLSLVLAFAGAFAALRRRKA